MRVVVASAAQDNVDDLRRAVKGLGLDCDPADCVVFANFGVRLSKNPPPDLVLVVADHEEAVATQAVEYATQHAGCPVFAVGTSPTATSPLPGTDAQQRLNRASLREELLAAMDQLHTNGIVKPRRGRLLAVVSPHGGAGATAVATNLAFLLAEKQPNQVLFAELSPDVPHVALDLDLTVPHPLGALVADWQRSDGNMLKQAVVAHAGGVHCLVHAPESVTGVTLPPGALRHLSILARSAYDQSVFDLGQGARDETMDGLTLADVVLVVFRPEVPSVRLTRRFLKFLHDSRVAADKIVLLANRTGWRQELAVAQMEQTLNRKIAESLPDDPAPLLTALNQGVPLPQVSRRAKLLKGLDRLIQTLAAQK